MSDENNDANENEGLTEPPRVIVIGAGMAGLAAAHKITKGMNGYVDLLVLERSVKPGGAVCTYELDDYILELGPDSFLTEKPDVVQLADELGIQDRIIGTNPNVRRSFIGFNNQLHALPEGFALLAPTQLRPFFESSLLTMGGKLRMAMDLFIPRGSADADESLAQFVRRRFGQEALERIAQPMLGGIYTADPELLSLRATMPRFLELEQKFSSVIKGLSVSRRGQTGDDDAGARYSMFGSFDKGLSVLVDALVEALPDETVHYNTMVVAVERGTRGKVLDVVLANGMIVPADAVVLACPSFAAADMLIGLDSQLTHELKKIQYASTAVLNLIYHRDDIPNPLDGFGFVVPAVERRSIVACSFASIKYPGRCPPGRTVLRVFVGGAMQQDLFELSDEHLQCLIWEDLHTYLGIEEIPIVSLITRYARAMPQYHIGHLDLVSSIKERAAAIPGLALSGNAYDGVGIPDCIRSGTKAAQQVVEYLKQRQLVTSP